MVLAHFIWKHGQQTVFLCNFAPLEEKGHQLVKAHAFSRAGMERNIRTKLP